jgi:hypothetical protein
MRAIYAPRILGTFPLNVTEIKMTKQQAMQFIATNWPEMQIVVEYEHGPVTYTDGLHNAQIQACSTMHRDDGFIIHSWLKD